MNHPSPSTAFEYGHSARIDEEVPLVVQHRMNSLNASNRERKKGKQKRLPTVYYSVGMCKGTSLPSAGNLRLCQISKN